MIRAEYVIGGLYNVKLDVPDENVIRAIAAGYSISQEAALVATITRGMDRISKQLRDIADKKTAKRIADNPDYGGD